MTQPQWQTQYQSITSGKEKAYIVLQDAGVIQLLGRDRQTFLQGMVTQDILHLKEGESCEAALLDPTAHVLAYFVVHNMPDQLLLEVDQNRISSVLEILDKYLIMEKVALKNVSSEWGIISLYSHDTIPETSIKSWPGVIFAQLTKLGQVVRTNLWIKSSDIGTLIEALEHCQYQKLEKNLEEIFRVEAGLPKWGNELDSTVLFPEAGLQNAVSYTKGCYIGQEIVARIDSRGHTNRSLRSVVFDNNEVRLSPNDTLYSINEDGEIGKEIGRLTSIIISPKYNGRPLALGYIRHEFCKPGTKVAAKENASGVVL